MRDPLPGRSAASIRPILKWAGGKRQLLPALRPFYPATFARYFEPFLGSGAVFLDLYNSGMLADREVHLSDINADVIGCYRAVRDRVEDVICSLRALESGHVAGGAAHFYAVRNRDFNPARKRVHAAADPAAAYTPELAAMLIYLNRTGYNGLFRVNARGEFNVPAGRYARPRICDEHNIRLLSAALCSPRLTLDVRSFTQALDGVRAEDFVYLDPPYAPVSETARFTSYTPGGFGEEEQQRLQQAVIRMASQNAFVLLSNSATPAIQRLYEGHGQAGLVGLVTRQVAARRAINSQAARRGPVGEFVISNVSPRATRIRSGSGRNAELVG
jgi:DNA adenine methylase